MQMNLFTEQKPFIVENRLVVAKVEGRKRWLDWELGIQFSSVQSLSHVQLFATP